MMIMQINSYSWQHWESECYKAGWRVNGFCGCLDTFVRMIVYTTKTILLNILIPQEFQNIYRPNLPLYLHCPLAIGLTYPL